MKQLVWKHLGKDGSSIGRTLETCYFLPFFFLTLQFCLKWSQKGSFDTIRAHKGGSECPVSTRIFRKCRMSTWKQEFQCRAEVETPTLILVQTSVSDGKKMASVECQKYPLYGPYNSRLFWTISEGKKNGKNRSEVCALCYWWAFCFSLDPLLISYVNKIFMYEFV